MAQAHEADVFDLLSAQVDDATAFITEVFFECAVPMLTNKRGTKNVYKSLRDYVLTNVF